VIYVDVTNRNYGRIVGVVAAGRSAGTLAIRACLDDAWHPQRELATIRQHGSSYVPIALPHSLLPPRYCLANRLTAAKPSYIVNTLTMSGKPKSPLPHSPS
jgi:hypothetical protein